MIICNQFLLYLTLDKVCIYSDIACQIRSDMSEFIRHIYKLAETLKKIVDNNAFFKKGKTFEIKIKNKKIWQ